jgi:putative cardiolipin synthase
MLFGGWHLNRRMHNKAWIADGGWPSPAGATSATPISARNRASSCFRDLDLVLRARRRRAPRRCSSATGRASWRGRPGLVSASAAARTAWRGCAPTWRPRRPRPEATRYLARLEGAPDVLGHRRADMVAMPRGAVRVVADPPEKAEARPGRPPRGAGRRRHRARDRRCAARRASGGAADLALFRARRAGLALILQLRAQGVRVSVVTNSLAATDVVAVHGGYCRYRRACWRRGWSCSS